MEPIRNDGVRGAELGAEAVAAVAVLARLDAAGRRAALEALGVTEARRIWTPREVGELPSLTALTAGRDHEAVYGSDAWAASYQRARTVVAYVLQAPGLGALSARLNGTSLAKVGTAALESLAQRVADLGRCEYGAWMRGPRCYGREAGFSCFSPAPRLQLAPQHVASPVRLCLHGVEVDLPPGMTAGQFEAALNRALLPLRLQTVAGTEAGRVLCARASVETAFLHRYYRHGTRYKAATEITLMRPQADLGALARVCADIVVDAALGLRNVRPVQ
ncbi:hypothetical protein [Lichenibacterium dinghuense]|uniref:hypothetical protein n=1 Tax=Lichenibacterium dinghuense TaxID=2895977 RepID=UPI001F415B41|nr:hypothetical protein [Lichenibacterium sp. 6Y81]